MSLLAFVSPIGCGDAATDERAPGGAAPTNTQTPTGPTILRHEFGTLRHGTVATHEFLLDGPGGFVGFQPRGFQAGCQCGAGAFFIVGRDGARRDVSLGADPAKVVRDGERLGLELEIDTRLREAVDAPPLTSQGVIFVQHPGDAHPEVQIGVVYTFAIDAPVVVKPFAHVAIGRLHRAATFRMQFELSGDAAHPSVRFGRPELSDPRLAATLDDESGKRILTVTFTPRGDEYVGALPAMQIDVPTNLADDYVLRLPVSGTILPDFEVEPAYGIAFGAFEPGAATESFANLLLHDRSLPLQFVVRRIRDRGGKDLAPHFGSRLEVLEGSNRTVRLHLRSLGTLRDSFRGVVELVPEGRDAPTIEVEFRGFRK